MKKIVFVCSCIILISANSSYANKTSYGSPVLANNRLSCNQAVATCYTVYDNGSYDVFFPGGTQHWPIARPIKNSTNEEVPVSSLPETIEPGEYDLLIDEEGGV